ncbi:hypothetical protein VKT23_008243 [Stygiomarasmius scandens]|uniref:Uncharacterized protein n=1 Tax=Marasmiellus scandens TaxID=2682957 RepID=A0ABR1JKY1_9AGAR
MSPFHPTSFFAPSPLSQSAQASNSTTPTPPWQSPVPAMYQNETDYFSSTLSFRNNKHSNKKHKLMPETSLDSLDNTHEINHENTSNRLQGNNFALLLTIACLESEVKTWKNAHTQLADAIKQSESKSTLESTNTQPLDRSDCPKVKFWKRNEYTTYLTTKKKTLDTNQTDRGPTVRGSVRASMGINCQQQYIETRDGVTVDGFQARDIRTFAHGLFRQYLDHGKAPLTWGSAGNDVKLHFYCAMVTQFEEMGLCKNYWKADLLAIQIYSSWYKSATKDTPHTVKKEPQDAPKMEVVDETGMNEKKCCASHNDDIDSLEAGTVKRTKTNSTLPKALKIVNPLFRPTFASAGESNSNSPMSNATPTSAEPVSTADPETDSVQDESSAGESVQTPDKSPELDKEPDVVPSPNTLLPPALQDSDPKTIPSPALDTASSHPEPSVAAAASSQDSHNKNTGNGRMKPTMSTTPRNLCAQQWVRKYPNGKTKEFAAYWDSIKDTAESDPFKQASLAATCAKQQASAAA